MSYIDLSFDRRPLPGSASFDRPTCGISYIDRTSYIDCISHFDCIASNVYHTSINTNASFDRCPYPCDASFDRCLRVAYHSSIISHTSIAYDKPIASHVSISRPHSHVNNFDILFTSFHPPGIENSRYSTYCFPCTQRTSRILTIP